MATLVRLGANPLLKNAAMRGPLQLLGLKCFPPNRFSNKTELKGNKFREAKNVLWLGHAENFMEISFAHQGSLLRLQWNLSNVDTLGAW